MIKITDKDIFNASFPQQSGGRADRDESAQTLWAGLCRFTQRCKAVITVIDEYLRPLLIGREARDIQDLWTLMYQHSYWRNSPVLNSAFGGIDLACGTSKERWRGCRCTTPGRQEPGRGCCLYVCKRLLAGGCD
ncbi:MAG: hypothetical protein ACLR0U_14240 [Enterocloster clostridioformis]